jgi:hypothetical protein
MSITTQQLLNEVNEALSALITGGASSYSIQGRTVTKLDVNALLEARDRLTRELERQSGAGIFTVAKFNRTSR